MLAAFLVLAYIYVSVIQPRYGPDEPRHLAYVKRLVEKGQLPRYTNGTMPDGTPVHVEEDNAHTQHPPLYYVLVSPLYLAARPFGETAIFRTIKAFSPILLGGALLLFLGTLRRVFPERPFAVAAALTLVALLPEFQLLAGVMNNDTLAIFLGSLFFWLLARSWDRGPDLRTAVVMGLTLAAIANTKATVLTLSPLWALALLLRYRRQPGRTGEWARDLLVSYGLMIALGCWWYVRNYQLYGSPVVLEYWGGVLRPHHPRTGAILSPLEVYTSGEVLPLGTRSAVGLFQSFWTQIDWIPEELRPAVWGTFLVLLLLAVAGGVRWLLPVIARLREGKAGVPEAEPAATTGPTPLVMLGGGFLLNAFSTWYIATFEHLGVYQGGRYLMPSVFGAGALLAAGWSQLIPKRAAFPLVVALAVALLALNAVCINEIVTVLNPLYVR